MDACDFQLERNPFGRLVWIAPTGERFDGVTPVRAFPVSMPAEGLSLLHADGHELAWIERLDALPPAVRSLIEEELAAREFAPEILRLKSVSTFSTPSTWEVETDRGDTRFVLKGEEDIRRLDGAALLITGGQGVHFKVRDMLALDPVSRRLLGRFL
ncbi:DUF1854 domain-containing protein [Rhodoferax sediminis]|jgi:hypothetical protein|uniref:DUF1854 domain-containing protein n=1 Tax=Rhodoferax sediminis TaxID=2509614 RepID=A0A515D9R5_9BURK|nr:DUF1854 domain-containing protein [Rhodoferax sediminis]QDL37139.1 DUF1854 domain-containing protein [Rhodoferax sediminis]